MMSYSFLKLDGAENLIPECRPSFNLLQSMIGVMKDEDLSRCSRELVEYKAESQPEFVEKEVDWHQVSELIDDQQFTPNMREGVTVYETAWEFAVKLYCSLKLSTKNAYKAICNWSAKHSLNLTSKKIHQLLSNARGVSGGKSIPATLWNTDRWVEEKNNRPAWKQIMIDSTKLLCDHVNGDGWNAQDNQQKLALRQLTHWQEGRYRCGNSYWWIKFSSPGMEHQEGLGRTCYCKTAHACGAPGCPDCALWQTERETAEWDWELAYGIQCPVVLQFSINSEHGPKDIKLATKKMVTRDSVKRDMDGCFGVFVPTAKDGYTLQLMLPLERANDGKSIQALAEQWSKVCRQLFNKHGQVKVTEPGLPAIELAVKLVLSAERDLFKLLVEESISAETAWSWFTCWVGKNPGAKGMNRVFHAPGFRRYRIELDNNPDLPPNKEETELDGISGNDEEEAEPEREFPRTWFSLESQVKKGNMLRVYDPYIQQQIYVEIGMDTIGSIPKEYLDPKTMKPLTQNATTQSMRAKSIQTGLSQAQSLTREIPLPPNGPSTVTAHIPDPWFSYNPEQRAIERGTFKGKKGEAARVDDNRVEQQAVLSLDQQLIVEKKMDPDMESNLLILKLF